MRRLVLGSGPLKRWSDRVQMLARLLLGAAVAAAVPLGLLAGSAVTAELHATAQQDAASRFPARATLLADARAPATSGTYESAPSTVATNATWAGPGGTAHVGRVSAPAGRHAGSSVPIWLDAAGRPTPAPLGASAARAEGATVGMLTGLSAVSVAAGAYGLVAWRLDRRRARDWARDWAVVEPLWAARFR
jgi:hypothetical protein